MTLNSESQRKVKTTIIKTRLGPSHVSSASHVSGLVAQILSNRHDETWGVVQCRPTGAADEEIDSTYQCIFGLKCHIPPRAPSLVRWGPLCVCFLCSPFFELSMRTLRSKLLLG